MPLPVTPGPLSRQDAETVNQAVRDLYGFLNGLRGTPGLNVRFGAEGVGLTLDPQVIVDQGGGGTASPLTTKGDLWGYDTGDNRIPIGTNGQVLTADSTQSLGLKWAAAAAGTVFSGCRVYRNSETGLSYAGGGLTGNYVHFDAEHFDTDSYHDNATNNERMTAPASGYYHCGAYVEFNGLESCYYAKVYLVDNAGHIFGQAGVAHENTSPHLGNGLALFCSGVVSFASSDYFRVFHSVFTTAGGSPTYDVSTSLANHGAEAFMYKIGT